MLSLNRGQERDEDFNRPRDRRRYAISDKESKPDWGYKTVDNIPSAVMQKLIPFFR